MIQEVRGWHVLMVLIGFFGVTIAVNAYFVTVALQSAPGEYQKKSYLQGLRYNDVIAAREAQAAEGWAAEIQTRKSAGGAFVLTVEMKDRNGGALNGLALTGTLRRPAQSSQDHDLKFEVVGEGLYRVTLTGIVDGQWLFEFDAKGGSAPFHAEKTLWVR